MLRVLPFLWLYWHDINYFLLEKNRCFERIVIRVRYTELMKDSLSINWAIYYWSYWVIELNCWIHITSLNLSLNLLSRIIFGCKRNLSKRKLLQGKRLVFFLATDIVSSCKLNCIGVYIVNIFCLGYFGQVMLNALNVEKMFLNYKFTFV